MAANNTISVGFKIEDVAGGFKQLTVDAKSFSKAMSAVVKEAEKLNKPAINFAALATCFDCREARLVISFRSTRTKVLYQYFVRK